MMQLKGNILAQRIVIFLSKNVAEFAVSKGERLLMFRNTPEKFIAGICGNNWQWGCFCEKAKFAF
jgi:hypothetical protein